MIFYSLALAAEAVVEAWILALVLVRGRRAWLQATFAAFTLTSIVNAAAFIGTSEGLLAAGWASAVLWTLVLANPLMTILVLSLVHGETVPRRRPAALALLALAPVVVLLTPGADWAVQHAYEPNLLGAYLIACLGIALAEPIYQRMTSALFAADSFWLALGVVALIIGGPIYAIEFQDLGIVESTGSNLASPIAVAAFALVLFHTDPFPGSKPKRSERTDAGGTLPKGRAIAFNETRPKYALHVAEREARAGRPVLVVARTDTPRAEDQGNPGTTLVTPTRHAALRTLGTIAEFCAITPGGLVVLPDLADLAVLSGWPRTHDAVLRMGRVCRDTGCTLVLSTSRLVPQETQELRGSTPDWWTLPDPAKEMEAILDESFGSGSHQLLEAFSGSRGLRCEDLSLDRLEAFLQFLDHALAELAVPVGDAAMGQGLHAQANAAAAALRRYALRDPADLAKEEWPSRAAGAADRGLVVTASDYWKGKEMQELFAAASDLGDRQPLFERARTVFVEQMGEAGEGVLRSELAKLGRRPEDLRAEDVARLADQAAVDLAAMADIVDVPQEKLRIRSQVESIRRRLETIAGGEP